MIRLTQLMGQRTISLADAEHTGKVAGVRIKDSRVVGVHTGDGLVDASEIRSFEGDAITHDGNPRPVDQKADSPLGRRVLDEDGDELGRLADLDIEADGTVTLVALDDGRTIEGQALRAIGSYAVIVAALPDTTLT
jgi:PRC-barrel domain